MTVKEFLKLVEENKGFYYKHNLTTLGANIVDRIEKENFEQFEMYFHNTYDLDDSTGWNFKGGSFNKNGSVDNPITITIDIKLPEYNEINDEDFDETELFSVQSEDIDFEGDEICLIGHLFGTC